MVSLSVFVSSPGDVALEREITRKTLDQLGHEFQGRLSLLPYFWEYEPQDFSLGYQSGIPKASTYDIVICIFFSRMGTPLTVDGQTYPSGSAYELMEAKAGKAARIAAGNAAMPNILVFVNRSDPKVSLKDQAEREKRIKDWESLNCFLEEQTRDGNQYIGAINRYETLEEFQDKLEAKLRSLIERHLKEHDGQENEGPLPELEWKGDNPFRGLFAFEFEHAPIFFGRRMATGAVIQAFQAQVEQGRPRFVMILGASGSGKSSLARAGVLPTLVTQRLIEGVGLWRRAIMKPSNVGGDLFGALAAALLAQEALPELADDGTTRTVLAERLRADPKAAQECLRGALRQVARAEQARQSGLLKEQIGQYTDNGRHQDAAACQVLLDRGLTAPKSRLVLLVDQFEEIYTAKIPVAQVESFSQCLRGLAEASDGLVFVMATVPSVFYENVMEDEHLRTLMTGDGVFALPAPTDAEFTRMIRLPAQVAGLRFEENEQGPLDERLLADARSNPGCLPLLEYCLEELVRDNDHGLLTHQAYDNLGTLSGVLARRAGDTFNALPPSTRTALDIVLSALIARDPNQLQIAVRRAAPWEEVAATPEAKELLKAFIGARLLIRDTDANNQQFVSVAHEALLRHWAPAQEWIGLDANQDFMRRRERLEQSYRAWLAKKKHRQFLLPSGIQLAEAQHLIEQHPHAFQEMRDYVRASVRRQKLRRYSAVSGILLVLFAAALYYSYFTKQESEAALAQAGQLVAQADRSLAQKDFATAEIASAKALTIRDDPSTRSQLLHARSGGVSLVARSSKVTPDANPSSFSRDGDLAAVVIKNGTENSHTISVLNTADQTKVVEIPLKYAPECLAFDRRTGNVRHLACARPDPHYDIEIWSVDLTAKTATPLYENQKPWGKHAKRVPALAFHPSKEWLASCSEDQTLRLWDYATDPPQLRWEQNEAHGTAVHGIAFSEDGTLLGSGGSDYLVKVWSVDETVQGSDPPAPLLKYELKGHTDSVYAVAFSPDGKRLASGGLDRVILIWNLELDQAGIPKVLRRPTVGILNGHEGTVLQLAFSKDGRLLVSGGKDKTVRLWLVNQGRILATLKPDCGVIQSVAYLKFGGHVYCGGVSGWSIWSVRERAETIRLWNGGATITAVAFDPQGQFIAVGGNDGKIRIWDREYRLLKELESGLDGEMINGEMINGEVINEIAIDAQSRWLAAAGESGRIHVWDHQQNWEKVDAEELIHDGPVWGLCFHPQGNWLASSNADKKSCIKQWDTANWKPRETMFEQSDEQKKKNIAIYALACYPDGKRLISGDDAGRVIVYDADTGKKLWSVVNVPEGKPTERIVWDVAVCPDPFSVFTGNSDGHVRRWVPEAGKDPTPTSENDAKANPTINSVSYSQKHRWIAAVGDGSSVEIYDLDLKKKMSLVGQEGTQWMVAFDPAGSRLASGGADRILRVWNIDEMQRTRQTTSPRQLYEESQKATGLSVENGKIISFHNR